MAASRPPGSVAASLALMLALVASVVLTFAPLGSRQEAVVGDSAGAEMVGPVEEVSLIETEGSSVLILLAVPVVVAALGALAAWLRWPQTVGGTSAGLLAAFALVGVMSIGAFYLPSAVAMVVAAVPKER